MKNPIKSLGLLCIAFVALATNACTKQEDPAVQTVTQTVRATVKSSLQPLIQEMMTDEAVKAYVLDGVKFSNAHATWFKALDSSEQKAFKAKMAADRAARRVESPIMTRAKLEDAYKAQTKQFEQVQKHFPALVQLSVEDNEEIFYEVERGVIAGNDVHEVNGACGSGYRACQRDCNRVFSCLDACYIGYLACLQASNPVLP